MIVDTAKLAQRLRALVVEEIGVHLPPGAELEAVAAVCRDLDIGIVGLDASPGVVVTADGVVADGVVRALKHEVDEAVPEAQTVLVIRLVGDVPLAPTLDAYLDTEMTPGRDSWLDDLVTTH